MNIKTLENLFASAAENEVRLAQFYARVSKMFPQVPGLADFWRDLTHEEEEHGAMLREVAQSLTAEQLHSPASQILCDDLATIRGMIEKRFAQPIETLDDAYEVAHEFEFSEVNTVFKALATEFVRSDLRAKFVSAEVVKHQQKLVAFSRKFGGKAWRKEIKACPMDA